MTNARGPQRSEDRSVTDADREAARAGGFITLGANEYVLARDAEQAIARARAEGAASEREACAAWHDEQARDARASIGVNVEMEVCWLLGEKAETHEACAAAIRARGEGGKA